MPTHQLARSARQTSPKPARLLINASLHFTRGHEFSQKPAGVTVADLTRNDIRRSLRRQLAAAIAALGAKINDPVRGRHDIQVVFDDDHGIASIDEPLQYA